VPFPKVVRAMAYGMWVVRKLLGLGCSHNSGISGTVSCHKKITEHMFGFEYLLSEM
jgi:hypothetical protein